MEDPCQAIGVAFFVRLFGVVNRFSNSNDGVSCTSDRRGHPLTKPAASAARIPYRLCCCVYPAAFVVTAAAVAAVAAARARLELLQALRSTACVVLSSAPLCAHRSCR